MVNKPGSWPIHPGGSYKRNCLLSILRDEYQLPNLHVVHRLDRLTSGLILLAKTKSAAKQHCEAIQGNQVTKVYLAKVAGAFPAATDTAFAHIPEVEYNEEFYTVHGPIHCKSAKDNVRIIHATLGQPASTKFQRIAYDGQHSIIKCIPITGRTHQIRVHLQLLGFPIVNDPTYGKNNVHYTTAALPNSSIIAEFPHCPVCVNGMESCFTSAQLYAECIYLHALTYSFTKSFNNVYCVPLPSWIITDKQ